jgi:hypothetical protein
MSEPPAQPEPTPVVQPPTEPPAVPTSTPAPTDEPSSYRVLKSTDLEGPPKLEPMANLGPARAPLTVLSGRRGEID